MRISHRELESCRSGPRQWVASRVNPQSGWSFGYNQALLLAIHRFHKLGANAARQHLDNMLNEHFTDQSRIDAISHDLLAYIQWADQTNLIVADSKIRINLDVGGYLVLAGEVSRLDITNAGYRAVILGSKPPYWREHLRLPLIQRAIARNYGRPIGEIEVGMQNLDGTELETLSFTETEIGQAENDFRVLGASVRGYFTP